MKATGVPLTNLSPGTKVEILLQGQWVGPFSVTDNVGRTPDHLVLSGPSGLFEQYNDYPFNLRTVD